MTEPSRIAARLRRRRRDRRLLTGVAALSTAMLVGGLFSTVDRDDSRPAPAATAAAPTATAVPSAEATVARPAALTRPVPTPEGGFLSWAMLDRRTGTISGSTNLSAPSDSVSMIDVWLAADYLRRSDERGRTPPATRLRQLSLMIHDRDDTAVGQFYQLLGGAESIERMVRICHLTESGAYLNRWQDTIISARDAARLGGCLADGRAAGGHWTPWLLDEMRQVRGPGDFGVREALADAAAAGVAVNNGWLLREDKLWHIGCLAIGDGWTLSVLARYPARLGLGYGAGLCRDIGGQLTAR